MASKYGHIVGKLPKFVDGDVKYRDKIEEEKGKILEEDILHTARGLAELYAEQRAIREATEKTLKGDNLRLEAIRQLFCEAMDEEDTTSLTLTGIGAIRVQVEPYAQVMDKPAFRRWCVENGLEESLSLPWQSTNSITKQRLLDGLPEPEGVEAFQKDKVVLTRTK